MTLLDLPALAETLEGYEHRLFRLETLPRYAVASDGDDFHRFVRGEVEPDWARKEQGLAVLRRDRDAGKARQRVRILSAELTEYERYSCEWGYAINGSAGEAIRVLRRGEHDIPPAPLDHDFWLVDDQTAVSMVYDRSAAFVGGQVLTDRARDTLLKARDLAWAAAEPFDAWWARHPELHRQVAV